MKDCGFCKKVRSTVKTTTRAVLHPLYQTIIQKNFSKPGLNLKNTSGRINKK